MRALLVVLTLGLIAFGPGAAGAPTPEPADVQAQAYFTAPLTDVLPPILTDELPPSIVCVLAPELCTEEIETLTDPIEGVLGDLRAPVEPVQPLVASGTLPVGLLAGQARYISAIDVAIPEPDPDMAFEHLELTLHETGPSFQLASPAFRDFVEAIVLQADETSPEAIVDALTRIAEGESALVEPEMAGIEACPIVEPWQPGENQDIAALPPVDCTFGADGVADGGTWRFDITLAARGWAEGTIPSHGLALRPKGPANLAYGDPDLSASFHLGYSTSGADGPTLAASFTPATQVSSPTPRSDGSEPPTVLVETPRGLVEVAAPRAAAPARAAPPATPVQPSSSPRVPGWYWLLVPAGLIAAGLYAHALRDDRVPAGAAGGALTRLLERSQR